ncbi:MAG: YitT family protein [Bacilli bacterium]|nr:YitT family protein [Bacilli bacterium]
MEDILKKIQKKKKLWRIILMGISLALSAILYNVFLLPLNLVTGGTQGIATITKHVYDIDPALMIFLLSAACAVFSLLYVGVERTAGTLVASVVYPLLVKITSPLATMLPMDTTDMLLLVLFAGVISGIANGLMYKTGYSNGGFPVVSQVLYEKKQISIAKSSLFINVSIVLAGSFFFGSTNTMYAIIFLYINNIVLDKVLLGISNNKAFYIITSEEAKIKEYIIKSLNHNITTFEVKGGFLEKKRNVMLTVIPSREYYRVASGIKEIDKDAFFVVTDSYQVEGAK